ncbi:MAG: hypothetical protein JJU46_02440 [Balneolaceae bacterium]|nr:hypothetical protein [Balneolaceae bacterium]MCH8548928.1 hypothetical protein [Balneolaceae bacterium]
MAAKKSKKQKKKNLPEPPDFWEKLSPTKKHILCLGFLFILPVFLFHASILGGQQYMGHDVIQWRAGAESLIQHQEQYDETAHWAENMFSGMPATTISHPPQISNLDNTLLRSLQVIYPAAEMWILLGGAYLMFLLLGARPLSAVFGAIIVGFSTYIPIIIGAGHNAKFLAYIYIPWLYNGYLMLTRSKINPWLAFFIFAWALTLHLRAYHPQVTYFFLFPLGTLFIYDLVKAVKSNNTKPFAIHTGYLVGAAAIATLIAVQLYWSTMEYSPFSMRGGSELAGTGGLSRDYAFAWSQGWGELLTLLIPGAYGGSELYWGPKTFTSGPHYFGALAALFFIVGVWKSSHKLKWVFLGPGIATLLFSLGEYFGALNNLMFAYFPLFDKFRVPEMWLMVTVFCFAFPAVFGLDWMIDRFKDRKAAMGEWKKPLYVALAVAAVAAFAGFQMLSFEKDGERSQIAQQIAQQNQTSPDDPRVAQAVERYLENELIPDRRELARGDTVRFVALFLIGAGLLWAMGIKKIPLSAGMIAFCVILAYDFISVDSRYLSERSLVDQQMTREGYIERTERHLDRFLKEEVDSGEGWKYRVLPMLDSPFNNATPSYFYPSAGGYSGAKLGYYQDLIDEAFFSGSAGINTGVLNMLNIRFLSIQQPVGIPGFATAYQGDDGVVVENQNVLPKAWFVNSVESLDSQPDVLRRISQDFDAAETAFVAGREPSEFGPADAGTVRVTEYNANAITLEISRDEPGFMVLGEIWYPPGWNATLNGEEIEIIRTNYVLRGFEIPAGEHQLEMRMEPVWYATGNTLAVIGTVLLFGSGAFGLFMTFRRRESEPEPTTETDS